MGTNVSGEISTKHMLGHPEQTIAESGVFVVGPSTVVVAPTSPDPAKVKEIQLIASSMRITPQFLDYWRKLGARPG